MSYYDVFNGDADGICSLHQLRLAEPRQAELVSGVKRDIRLLGRLRQVRDSVITVLDLSLETNRADLVGLLESCRVFYADHHFAGEIPKSANLEPHLDPSPATCTGLIIDRLLAGRHRSWAVVAAYGDNLHESARRAAEVLALRPEQLLILRELGELMNYNGYGRKVEDLHFCPVALYRAVQPFADPFDFYHQTEVAAKLREGFESDMAAARAVAPEYQTRAGRLYFFPAESWGQRAAGVFINEKAREEPEKGHGLLVANADSTFTVSVRAPAGRPGADSLCRLFPNGGGRSGAAGINGLPGEMVGEFVEEFERAFG